MSPQLMVEIVVLVMGAGSLAGAAFMVGRTKEWRQVAEARGEKVEDLETELTELKARVAALEVHIKVLEDMNADRIADKVVDRLQAVNL